MRSGPEDPAALGAGFEAVMCFINIFGNTVANILAGDIDKGLIAVQAPREERTQMLDPSRSEYLSDLILNILAFEEDELPDRFSDQESCIQRKKYSPFAVG